MRNDSRAQAIEFGEIECIDVLLNRGASINQPAEIIDHLGGQSPIFHAIATNQTAGLAVLEHLLKRGDQRIDLSLRATFRRYGEPQKIPVTPLEYAEQTADSEEDPREANEREITLLKSL